MTNYNGIILSIKREKQRSVAQLVHMFGGNEVAQVKLQSV